MAKMPEKFDPKQFEKDRKSVKARQESEARVASRQPAPAPEKKGMKPLTERIVFGAGSRNQMSKRLGK